MDSSREGRMVVVARDQVGEPTVWCDPEIVDLVSALNAAGLKTTWSCSGHGHRPGMIGLADGRQIMLLTMEQARIADAAFPIDINGERRCAT